MDDLKIDNWQQVFGQLNENFKSKSTSKFSDMLKGAIERVGVLEKEADRSIMDLLKGKADVNETMIALQKADISMRLLLTVRNKALEAYKQIIQMQF